MAVAHYKPHRSPSAAFISPSICYFLKDQQATWITLIQLTQSLASSAVIVSSYPNAQWTFLPIISSMA